MSDAASIAQPLFDVAIYYSGISLYLVVERWRSQFKLHSSFFYFIFISIARQAQYGK